MGLNPHHVTGSARLTTHEPCAVLVHVVAQPNGDHKLEMAAYPLPEADKLAAMQKAVGGHIEHIHIGPSRHRKFVAYDGWVNDEGLLQGLPCHVQLRVQHGPSHSLVRCHGPLLVTAGESLSGETVPLIPEEVYDLVLLTMSDGLPVVSVSQELPDA